MSCTSFALDHVFVCAAGAIVVLEPGERCDPERDQVFVISDPSSVRPRRYYVNGSLAPPPQELRVGTTYRFRIANPGAEAPNVWFRVTHDSTPAGTVGRPAGDSLSWRPVARDGWPLAGAQSLVRPSGDRVGSGQTADFEFTPERAGDLTLQGFQLFQIDARGPQMGVGAAVRLRVSPSESQPP